MNDFTKEELRKLLSWADVYIELGRSWTTRCQMPLIDKIQSLIDNYCDHDLIRNQQDQYHCAKCGKSL